MLLKAKLPSTLKSTTKYTIAETKFRDINPDVYILTYCNYQHSPADINCKSCKKSHKSHFQHSRTLFKF